MGSTGGYVIAAANPAAMQGMPSPVTLVSWRSGKPARKARSSLAAEAQALSETDQELMFVRLAWAELCGDLISLSESTGKIAAVRGTVVIGAKSLYDILLQKELYSSSAGLEDKYSTLEVLCLLESSEKMKTEVRWAHSEAQVADGLTKPLPPGILRKIMHGGMWTLHSLTPILRAPRNSRRADVPILLKTLWVCQLWNLMMGLRSLIQSHGYFGPYDSQGSLLPIAAMNGPSRYVENVGDWVRWPRTWAILSILDRAWSSCDTRDIQTSDLKPRSKIFSSLPDCYQQLRGSVLGKRSVSKKSCVRKVLFQRNSGQKKWP